MKAIINRVFSHRTHGLVGEVSLTAHITDVEVNGKALPDASVEYLLNFALQSLQDAYAGAKNSEEAKGFFAAKLDKLIAGEIGVRGSGDGVSEEIRVARSITKAMAKKNMGEGFKAFTELSDTEQNNKLDAWYAANETTLAPFVKEESERREKARKAKASLASAVAFEL